MTSRPSFATTPEQVARALRNDTVRQAVGIIRHDRAPHVAAGLLLRSVLTQHRLLERTTNHGTR